MRNFVARVTFCVLKVIICIGLNVNGQKRNKTKICCHLNGNNYKLDCIPLQPKGSSLDISYKGLENLPFCEKSNAAKTIVKLDLDNNNISEHDFDKIFVTFPNLNSLLMFNNNLSVLNGNRFKEPNKLSLLDLGSNQIYKISVGFFTSFERLEELKLEKNRLIHLPHGVFQGLKTLQTIDLSSNFLPIFKMDWFDKRTPLTSIHIGNNKVSSWEPFDFTWPMTMKKLNFSGNRLPAIPPLPPSHSNNDKEWSVDLLKNPLFCGCRQESHKEHFAKEDVACRLRLECQDVNMIPNSKCKNGEFTTKKWLSKFVKQPLCVLPKVKCVKKKNPNLAIYDISCIAVGYPPPDVNIRSEHYNFNIVPRETNQQEFFMHVSVDENHSSNITCEAVNIFGSDLHGVAFTHVKTKESKRSNMLVIAAISASLSLVMACAFCIWNVYRKDFLISKYNG